MKMNRFGFAMLFSVVGLTILWSCGQKQNKTFDFIVVAHRGVVDGERMENSLASLEETINQGYTHVEVDLRCIKDGTVVCFHDGSLERVLGINKVLRELTLPELKEITSTFSSNPIPTFDEFCSRCQGQINLMPDIKRCPASQLDQYVTDIEHILKRYHLLDGALIIGDTEIVDKFYGKTKIAWRDRYKEALKSEKAHNDPSRYFFIFNHGEHFNKEEVDGFHKMGLKIIVSINNWHYPDDDPDMQYGQNDIQRMVDLGVDGLQIDSQYGEFVFRQIKK